MSTAILAAMKTGRAPSLTDHDVERFASFLRDDLPFTNPDAEAGRAIMEDWVLKTPGEAAREFALHVARANTRASTDPKPSVPRNAEPSLRCGTCERTDR